MTDCQLKNMTDDAGRHTVIPGQHHNSRPDTQHSRYPMFVNVLLVSVLLSAGCSPPAPSPSGMRHVRAPKTLDNNRWVTEFHLAIWKGDVELVRSMIASGADLYAVDWEGDTPLFQLSKTYGKDRKLEHLEIARILVEAGIDLDTHLNQSGFTCLQEAAAESWPTLVLTLLELGADVDATGTKGATPLLRAAGGYDGKSSEETMDILIKHGANLNAKTKDGESLLDLAKSIVDPERRPEAVKYIQSKLDDGKGVMSH